MLDCLFVDTTATVWIVAEDRTLFASLAGEEQRTTSPKWKPENQPESMVEAGGRRARGEEKRKKRGGEQRGSPTQGSRAKTHLQTGPGGSYVLQRQTALSLFYTRNMEA